ncbi:MAG TPA: heavy metal-binding domain-containing protein [Streptosporangiaceae bacterium]|nr:heavy metal-binding domain-containing protein [Streptosporangiaceae bacterium]
MASQWSGQGLPPVARARLAEIKNSGTWGSALSTGEFAAIRSAGFEPVGQVLGAAVYNLGYSGYGYTYACPSGMAFNTYSRTTSWQPGYTAISSSRRAPYSGLVQGMYAARHKAIDRMAAECAGLGGHGVVGVRLTIGRFPAGGMEFHAIGTAVRAPGGVKLKRVFTSDLSGQDFAKLIADGVVPVGLALGISVGTRHDDWTTRSQTRWSSGNTEVGGYTELVNMTRHDARTELEKDVKRLGGEGVVIQSMDLQIGERECPVSEGARDHIAEATIIGTAITHFRRSSRKDEGPSLAMLSLDPERRRSVRLGINN